MKNKMRLLTAAILFISLSGFAQQKDTVLSKLNSTTNERDSTDTQINNIKSSSENEIAKITFRSYLSLLVDNLKQDFSKPFHMTRKDWGNFAKYALAFAALSFADEPMQKYSVKLTHNNPSIKTISSYVTKFGGPYEKYSVATLAVYGLIFKKPRLVNTTLLASQAYFTGSAIEVTMKFLSGRTRPNYYMENEEAEPSFFGPFKNFGRDVNGKRRYSSFPSGHAIVAFGVATVFAEEYKDKKFVPVLAYSVATLVGLSRMTENRHWASDILTGAAIGYLTGKNVVNNYHSYVKRVSAKQSRNTISYNLQYLNRQLIPGIVYTFR